MENGQLSGDFQRFDKKSLLRATIASILYLLVEFFLSGYRPDHGYFLLFCLVCYFAHPATRRLVLGFSIFFVYGIIFDSMKGYPNYWFANVHIEQPYNLEKYLFGINTPNGILTPNEYFLANSTTFLDVLSGSFYINWMPIPLIFGLYLWFTDKLIFVQFSAAFFTVNVLGWIIYYTYPAAPPWYVQLYGFELYLNTPGNVAGLLKFDEFFGSTTFQDLYSKGSNVFAAMPSLHSAYPVVVFFYGIKKKVHWAVVVFFGVFVLGIWFAAVYTSHHYILDVILGAMCSIAGIWIFERYLMKTKIGVLVRQLAGKV
ncbi:MAG: phosphatase PAP2 family protein [Cyclobacteriaceae bacterium]